MPLPAGSRIGPYEITNAVGAGGMGEVYRARDTRLGRDVAVKVLPDALRGDAERLARFGREARTLAALNHPTIGAIYGLEEDAGLSALILEFVEGPTLADRLARGPLPMAEEVLPIARQIALALAVAQEAGIVHRDLKPANIKVRPDGSVKVLDFGLAKAMTADGTTRGSVTSDSPTITSPAVLTNAGMLMGTPAYMSPEQARGVESDRRADLWAFGVVLWEMTTGRRLFDGATAADALASVLRTEPDWTQLPADTPPSLRRLLVRCLQKDRTLRLDSATAARLDLDDATAEASSGAVIPAAAHHRGRSWLAAAALAASLVAVAMLALFTFRPAAVPPEVRLDVTTPPATDVSSLAISPDGTRLAYEATAGGRSQLWLRSLDAESPRPLTGTDGARLPFWSRDGRAIVFFTGDRLKRINLDDSSIQEVARVGTANGGSSADDGSILFSPGAIYPILLIRNPSAESADVTRLKPQESGHRRPQFLPGGRKFLYTVTGTADVRGLYLADVTGGEARRLLDADLAVASRSGRLFVARQGGIFAHDFDPDAPETIGRAVPVMQTDAAEGVAALSVSDRGDLAYRFGSPYAARRRQLVWVDRAGRELERVGEVYSTNGGTVSLSRDRSHVAVTRPFEGTGAVWIADVARGVFTPFTSGPGQSSFPIWSPDERAVAYQGFRDGSAGVYRRPADRSGVEELLVKNTGVVVPLDWSSDGRYLLFRDSPTTAERRNGLWALPLDRTAERIAVVVDPASSSRGGAFSPDVTMVAYESTASGQSEIYVQPFPGPGAAVPVSKGGGAQVRWRRDGKQLFYIALDGRLMAVSMNSTPDGRAIPGEPVPLFITQVGGAAQGGGFGAQYDVSIDGLRFLMSVVADDATAPINVILNWRPR